MNRVMQLVYLLIVGFVAEPSFAGIHSYRIQQFTPSLQTCQVNESQVAERFKQQTGAKILSHGCEVTMRRSYDIVIEYARETIPEIVTTYDELRNLHGFFATEGECLAQLEPQVLIYRENTGLEPTVAFCFYDHVNASIDPSWTLRIDGFGSPRLKPFNYTRAFFETAFDASVNIESGIMRALSARGAAGVLTRVGLGRNLTTINVLYYAERKLGLVEYDTAYFTGLTHCESYRGLLTSVYDRAGGNIMAYVCAGSTLSKRVRAYALGIVTEPLATDLTSMKYPTFEACEAKRSEVEEAWRTGLERNVIASVCAYEDTLIGPAPVTMRLFWLE